MRAVTIQPTWHHQRPNGSGSSKDTLSCILNAPEKREDEINLELKKHICSLNYNEWPLAQLVQHLYLIFEIFNRDLFGGALTTPVITIEKLRVHVLGCYRIGRNEFGAKNHIKFNSKYIRRPRIEVYKTCLHEMLHQAEYEIYSKEKPNRGNYHSAFFQSMSDRLGIPCNEKGITIQIKEYSPFLDTLVKHNVVSRNDVMELEGTGHLHTGKQSKEGQPRSKLLKYRCHCTNVRVAKHNFRARCLNCGQEFLLAEAGFGDLQL